MSNSSNMAATHHIPVRRAKKNLPPLLNNPCILLELVLQKQANNATTSSKASYQNRTLPHPCLLGGPKEGEHAGSPLHSRSSPTKEKEIRSGCLTLAFTGAQKRVEMLHHPCILGAPQQRGTKSEVASSPLRSPGPKRGLNATSPLHSQGSPTKGNKIRSGFLTPAFWGGQKRAEMLHHPYILGDPQQRGTKSEVAASPLPSEGPKRGRKYHVTPAFSGLPNKWKQNQTWVPHPCLLGGPKEGGNATSPLHSRGSPTKGNKIRSGFLMPAFSGAQKRAKCYITPTFSGLPKKGEQNQK